MELKFNLDTMSSSQLGWLIDSLDAYRARRDGFTQHAQPGVAQNTGSSEPAPPFTGDPAGDTPAASGESAAEDSPPNASAAPAVTEQKRGRGRPRKETAQESTGASVDMAGTASQGAGNTALTEGASAKPSEQQAPAEPAKESAQPITIDDLRDALQGFTAKNGIEAGKALLEKHGAGRISEMAEQPEAAKAAFIKGCQA